MLGLGLARGTCALYTYRALPQYQHRTCEPLIPRACSQEDNATYLGLKRGALAGRFDIKRIAVLRTAINFDRQAPGQTAYEAIRATVAARRQICTERSVSTVRGTVGGGMPGAQARCSGSGRTHQCLRALH